jgi:hypothetical protein
LVGFGPVVAVTYNNNNGGEMRNQKSKCQCDVVSRLTSGSRPGLYFKPSQRNGAPTADQMRKVDVDELIVLDIDALQSRNVISRRRCPVNNFQNPVVPVWVMPGPAKRTDETNQINSNFVKNVKF